MIGQSIPEAMTVRLKPCAQCGNRPRDHERHAHPRKVELFAFGKLWKTEVVCWICGGIYRGPTLPDALNAWQATTFPKESYKLPLETGNIGEKTALTMNEVAAANGSKGVIEYGEGGK
jgi:hypothetical protein